MLRLIALGYTSVEVTRKLGLSPRTVETHRAHIYSKLALRTRSELVRYALRRGLLRASLDVARALVWGPRPASSIEAT